VRIWRLCKIKHIAFDGEGARRAGGRWNRRGTPVVYTSQSLSLAALELLVHCEIALAPEDLVAVPAEVPDAIAREELSAADLPRGWRGHPAPEDLALLGTDWIRRGKTAVLAVPSAVVPAERNFLLNPAHADFARIRVGRPEPFSFDPRLSPR
jgi:RES domain-containing protein